MSDQRQRFTSFQKWHDFIDSKTKNGQVALTGLDLRNLRYDCYREIEKLRGRPLIVYAADFLNTLPPGAPISIALHDVDGFTDLVSSIPEGEKEIDVLLHSPGGAPDATERIVKLLRQRFDKVHFLVPHSAYSAANMLAVSGDTITLHRSAVLGPIDPQINGIPARQIKRAFLNLQKKISEEGQESIVVFLPLIQKYDLHLLEICDDAEKLSKTLVRDWLRKYMLKGGNGKVVGAVNYMASFDTHLMHSRPLDIPKLRGFGLKIDYGTQELQDLMWEAHVLLGGAFAGIGFVKLYESPDRISWGKKRRQQTK